MVKNTSAPTPPVKHELRSLRRFFAELGPGLVTGAADDDPSGISTYSVAGAALGYSQLWTAIFSFPLMAAVQLMCARLGLVTGLGLAGVIRRRYPRPVLWGACVDTCPTGALEENLFCSTARRTRGQKQLAPIAAQAAKCWSAQKIIG